MTSRLSTAWHSLLTVFWPRSCSGCDLRLSHQPEGCFCPDCLTTLIPVSATKSCGRCAAPFLAEDSSYSPNTWGCSDCRRLQSPLFSSVTALYVYAGALVRALHQLKWEQRDDLAQPLGRLLGKGLAVIASGCDVLVPVPLHRTRRIQRGYNQAALLSHWAQRTAQTKLPLAYNALVRHSATQPQAVKDPTSRWEQVQHAFGVPMRSIPSIRNKRVLLVDDIVTTGATIQACSAALLHAGAISVDVLALARTAG